MPGFFILQVSHTAISCNLCAALCKVVPTQYRSRLAVSLSRFLAVALLRYCAVALLRYFELVKLRRDCPSPATTIKLAPTASDTDSASPNNHHARKATVNGSKYARVP